MKKKIISLALTAAMAVSLAACGSGNGTDTNETVMTREYTYVPEYIEMEDADGASLWNAQLVGESLYYTQYNYDEAAETSTETLNEYSLTEKKVVKELSLDDGAEGNRNRSSFQIGSDGSIYTIEYVYSEDYSDRKTLLCGYDNQGVLTWEQDITDIINSDSDNNYISNMLIDKEGRFYLSSNDIIRLFDKDGQYQGNLTLDSSWINSIGMDRDGKVYICYYDQSTDAGGYCLAEVDFNGKAIANVYQNYPSGNGNGLVAGIDKDFLVNDGSRVYEYDLASQSYEELFNWLDCDINGTYVNAISVMEDGRLIVLMNDWNTGANEIALLTKTRTADLPQKTQIVIGSLYDNQELQAAAVAFNKQSDTYHVSIKTYIDNNNWNENTYKDAITSMNNDITSGSSCPDIIDLSSLGNVEQLAGKGVFEDITPYLEKSSSLNKDDYLENILDSNTYNGVLVGIPFSFYLNTIVGKTSDVGEEMGWTLDEMIEYANENPDALLFDYAQKSSILYCCLAFNQDEFIDWSTNQCNFDSEEFKKLLAFVADFPDEFDWQADERSTPRKIQEGDVLLDTMGVSDFESVQVYPAMFGEPVTFIGYPTMDGSNGCMLNSNGALGISSKSQNKDGAWAFIESYLSRSSDERFSWGFPTRKSELDRKIEEATKVTYLTDENGEPILDEDGNPIPEGGVSSVGYGDWDYTYHSVTEEEAALVKQLIEAARPAASTDDQMITIITEEAEPFFKGQKSVDDVVNVIQSRIQLYLNENQ